MTRSRRAGESGDQAWHDEDVRDLYENAPCGYLSILGDGLIVKANATFLHWIGFAADDVVGVKHFIDLLTRGGQVFYETHFRPLLRMQGFVREIALDIVCSDGGRLPGQRRAGSRPDRRGTPFPP